MKPNKEYKARERQRKKELGFVRWECWCTPEHREVMQVVLSCLQADYAGPVKVNSLELEIKNSIDQ